MPYLRQGLPKAIRYRNRSTVLELLKTLATRDNLPQQETLVFAWGMVGLVCGETELNIVLLELVKALGHAHMMICGLAFNELRRLASELHRKPIDLFRPFWRSVAPDVVKDLISCPQKAQQLSEFVGLTGGVDELLVLTQAETVPFLVLTKNHAILKRIMLARKSKQLQELIMEPPRNLAGVLSRLLVESGDTEHAAAALLQDAAPNLRNKFVEVVKIDPILTACEILKAAGESDEKNRSKVT
jgi:serine/threonine-protein kinase ATR